MTPHGSDEVRHPPWLPDFVDAADVGDASLEASRTWGEDVSPAASAARQSPASASEVSADRSQIASARGFGRASGAFGSGGRQRPKGAGKTPQKHLTWAEKQQRREARAEKRREQEAKERAADPIAFAREIVLTQLTAAPRSRAQLAEKLRAKEVDEDVIDVVLDRMEDVGLVDDAAYAGMLVRSQMASRGLSRMALARELKRKGIEGEDAEEALAQIDDDSERERALQLARKKVATMSRLDQQTQTRRLAGLLARKGYAPSLVWSVVKEVLAEESVGSVDPSEAL